jgi:hypothetical protein
MAECHNFPENDHNILRDCLKRQSPARRNVGVIFTKIVSPFKVIPFAVKDDLFLCSPNKNDIFCYFILVALVQEYLT